MEEKETQDIELLAESLENQDSLTSPRHLGKTNGSCAPCAERLFGTLNEFHLIMERHIVESGHTNQILLDIKNWMSDYMNRSMPIRSHLIILIGSLSILASFAAVIKIIDKLLQ